MSTARVDDDRNFRLVWGLNLLGLPEQITACLFDLDGVLTDTASLHRAAWKQAFDDFLHQRDGADFIPFDVDDDYNNFVDGKPREDGVRDFLASREITLPEGNRDDQPDEKTIWGVGNAKNVILQKAIRADGVRVYEGSRAYLEAAQAAGLRRVVVSSSANAQMVLEVTGLAVFIEGRIDGVTLAERDLEGKPAPDSFLAGAQLIGQEPRQCAVFEDALAGVAAGAAGSFGYVIGVDRVGQRAKFREHGADVVVNDLADLLPADSRQSDSQQ